MRDWTKSIYSDGTEGYVSNPAPEMGEEITISLSLMSGAPVSDVLLWRIVNGAETYTPMVREKSSDGLDYYCAKTTLNEPVLQYHFVLVTEEAAFFYTQAGVQTYVPDYRHDFIIRTDYFKPDWVDGAVFYQIFPERFCNGDPSNDVRDGEYEYFGRKCIKMPDWNMAPLPVEESWGMDFFGGDLKGVKDKIPYLKELGVNVIYLNPIFTAYSTHKYDCIDYFHVDPHFGGDEALAELSEELHKNDMKLILDISVNHTGSEHEWTRTKREFYFKDEEGNLKGWAGVKSLPFMDYRNEELRDLIYRKKDSVLRKWLRAPYNIDGWRFDVADVLGKNDDVQVADDVWKEICYAIRQEKQDAFIIGEHWGDCYEYLQGDLWNTPMNYYGYGRVIRQFAGLPDLFLQRNETIMKAKYVMTAEDVVKRSDDHYNYLPQAVADCQMNLFDSHDVSRVHNYEEISDEKYRGVVLSYLLFTGIPCVYYGDELSIDGHTVSDAGCRYPMPWDRLQDKDNTCYALYKRMIELRRTVPAFAKGGRKVLLSEGRILAIARFLKGERYLGIISMEDEPREVTVPLWEIGATKALSDVDEFGRSFAAKSENGDMTIDVPAFGAYIIKLD